MAALGVTSRGNEDEYVYAIANLLNTEEHLTEAIKESPDKVDELAKELDNVRATRQKLVGEWTKGRQNPKIWCATKHAINTAYHLHELITNEARLNPEKVRALSKIFKESVEERNRLVKSFLAGKENGDCPRCSEDLARIYESVLEKAENLENPKSQALNTNTFSNNNEVKIKVKRGEKMGIVAPLVGQVVDRGVNEVVKRVPFLALYGTYVKLGCGVGMLFTDKIGITRTGTMTDDVVKIAGAGLAVNGAVDLVLGLLAPKASSFAIASAFQAPRIEQTPTVPGEKVALF